jgi:FixJ family two-component response regulator
MTTSSRRAPRGRWDQGPIAAILAGFTLRQDVMSASVHVAVIDDDRPVRTALARLLMSAGFQVSLFASAEEFLGHMNDLEPACLLLDLHLPRLSGLELDRVLRQLARTMPTVFITADHELAQSEEVRQRGIPCLIKPIDDRTLLAAIADAVEPHRA